MLKTFDPCMIPCRNRITSSAAIKRLKDKHRDSSVLYETWYFTSKEGHLIEVILGPHWEDPESGHPLPFAWTRFLIYIQGPEMGASYKLEVPIHDRVSSMPYENLDNRLYRSHNQQALLTLFIKIMVTYWRDDAWEILRPTKKWWHKCFINFKAIYLAFPHQDLDCEGLYKWTLPFDFTMLTIAVSNELKRKFNLLKNYVRTNTSKLPKNVSALMRHVPHTVVRAPVELDLNHILQDYANHSMKDVANHIVAIRPGFGKKGDVTRVEVYLDWNNEVVNFCANTNFLTDKLMTDWINTFEDKNIVTEKNINLRVVEAL